MNEEIDFILDVANEQMKESIVRLDGMLSKIRAGKANPQMLSSVKVDYYGTMTPLSQMSNINTPDPQTISVQPFDKGLIADIEKSILEANLGLTPMNNGELVMINIPALTEERRVELVKQVKSEVETSKVSVRQSRQKANDEIKKLAKNGISEDIIRDSETSIQDLTNQYIDIIDKSFDTKKQEIMTI